MSTNPSGSGPSSDEAVLSLDDLDKIIDAEDPNFKSEMAGIKEAGVDSEANIESIQVEGADENVNEKDIDRSSLSSRQKILHWIKSPWIRMGNWLRLRWTALRNRTVVFIDQSKQFIRHGLPERIKYYRSRAVQGWALFSGEVRKFLALSRLQKTALLFTLAAAIGSVYILVSTFKGANLPRFSDPLRRSFSDDASWVGTYRSKDDLQDLFHAFPEIEFYVLLKKVIVNLRPDENSSRNPMGVYEMYLGLDSQDTAIEVKDREREILDIMQRTLEQFSYSEVSSTVGKVRMKSAVRENVNTILNQGRVFHVYFNTFITNP